MLQDRSTSSRRYIYDPLYGRSRMPDLFWDVLSLPELQRLREIRMCNINSLCLMGGANISRFEHSVGTFRLAQECLSAWPSSSPEVTPQEERHLLLAALFHDVGSAAFGHSVEYVESLNGFDHESAFEEFVLGTGQAGPVHYGKGRGMADRLPEDDLAAIGELITGRGRLGPLLNSTIDLDNIDNVYRMAYHIGLVSSGEEAIELARSLSVRDGHIVIAEGSVNLVWKWHGVRKRLYEFLLLNPEEFSGKCMLTEAIETANSKRPFRWANVDHELLDNASKASAESSRVIARLMNGDLYGCAAILSTGHTELYGTFADPATRNAIASRVASDVRNAGGRCLQPLELAMHPILDDNKTERQVRLRTDAGRTVCVGTTTHRLLLGVFLKNDDMSMYAMDDQPEDALRQLRGNIRASLSTQLKIDDLQEIELYGEADDRS